MRKPSHDVQAIPRSGVRMWFDESGLLHREDGPALEFDDGGRTWASRGRIIREHPGVGSLLAVWMFVGPLGVRYEMSLKTPKSKSIFFGARRWRVSCRGAARSTLPPRGRAGHVIVCRSARAVRVGHLAGRAFATGQATTYRSADAFLEATA